MKDRELLRLKKLLAKVPHAADVGNWSPDAQVISNTQDTWHWPQVLACIKAHRKALAAYAVCSFGGAAVHSLSIELQFQDSEAAAAFRKDYNQVRLKPPRQKRTEPVKRLYNHRMYVLPDGRELWLFGRWNRRGARVGKVLADPSGFNEGAYCEVHNEIVDEDTLRKSRLVPKGEERWVMP